MAYAETMKVLAVVLAGGLSALHLAVAGWVQPPLQTEKGYPAPQPDYEPQVPQDLGAHPGYAIEWWYWVGHLKTVDGSREFGFQSTVFRLEGDARTIRSFMQQDPFGMQHFFMAHLSLSDLTAERYVHAERVFREGWQAQAATGTLDLKVGPIIAQWNGSEKRIEKELALPDGRMLEMKLKPVKPLVAFGERGLSRKGADPAAVSWYWTYPRLEISGSLIEGGQRTEVYGTAWMDHEVSSSQLGSDLVGWDWTAIQLDDGTEVKAYRLRTKEGGADPWSAVYWIDPEGKAKQVYAEDFEWLHNTVWKSDQTGNSYPTEVTIRATHPETGKTMTYRLEPLLDSQEFVGNRADNAYWEGACAVFDASGKRVGRAYLELVGYGGSISGQLNK